MSLTVVPGVRCLAFDGGGLYSISQALIIRDMMHKVEEENQLTDPPKVAEYFDMICGSGLGGLLAIMCGVLHMTGEQLVEEFVCVCKSIFSGDLGCEERTAIFENEMKRLVATYCSGNEKRKMVSQDSMCKTVLALSRTDPSLDCTIWEAARATTALSTLFNPIVIRDNDLSDKFVGGEVRWSNPSHELTKEAARVFKGRHVACIVSVGSGHPGTLSLSTGLSDILPRIAMDCERLADDMERRFGNAPDVFWRLSVEQGLQHLEIDLSNLDALGAHTRSYLQSARATRNLDALLAALIYRPQCILADVVSGEVSVAMKNLGPKICPPPTPYFTGRRHLVKRLEEYFNLDGESCHVAVLYGIGAGGKTQLGLWFIQENRALFSNVFFIDGSSKLTLENDLAAIAAENIDRPSVDDAICLLRSLREEWLLFIDNADDPSLNLHPYISWSHGNILITTRNRGARVHAPKCNIWVDQLDLEDAKELLLKGVSIGEAEGTEEVVVLIVKELGCLALAIEQARAFLANGLCTLAEYLRMYKNNRRQLLEERLVHKTDNYQYSVYTTWTISFVKLSPLAALLFELLSFMHHEAIPTRIFEDAWRAFAGMDKNVVPPLLASFLSNFTAADSTWDILRFRKLIGEILSLSLLDFNTTQNTLSLHPLVQQWARTHSQNHQALLCASQTLLSLGIPDGDTVEILSTRRALIPHIQDSILGGFLLHFTLLSSVGTVLLDGGLLQASSEVFQLELSAMQAELGTEHCDTHRCMNNLAITYSALGKHRDALKLKEKVLELRKQTLGDDHPDTLTIMNDLASSFTDLGKHHDALKLKEQVLELREKILGHDHPHTLITMSDLAITYSDLGKYQISLRLERQVLALRQQILGQDHPNTLKSMSNVASTCFDLGMHQDALEMEEQVLELRRRLLGHLHPGTLTSMNKIASIYSDLGKHQNARELKEEVLELRKRILGEEHPDTLTSMNNLAIAYSDLGIHEDSLKLKEQVLELRQQILGEDHPDTLSIMNNLSITYSSLGKYQDSLRLNEKVLALRGQILAEDHPDTLRSMSNLASSYSHLGMYREALKLQEHVMALRGQILGVDHPDTLNSMGNLASTYSDLGMHQDGLELEKRVLELRRRVLGQNHPHTLITMSNLASIYSDLGRFQDALHLQEQVLKMRRQVLGTEHADTVSTLAEVENLRKEIGREPWRPKPQRKRDKLKRFLGRMSKDG
ncbi:hypothetical protein DL96DRAFT_1684198 [Flagelloscypha sp. PMI_526]|nr:hypothetical protein DL96DRAFT_1684198 [Flagelloscypha sp. PMI_526]